MSPVQCVFACFSFCMDRFRRLSGAILLRVNRTFSLYCVRISVVLISLLLLVQIYCGGLPEMITESEVKQILTAFGELKVAQPKQTKALAFIPCLPFHVSPPFAAPIFTRTSPFVFICPSLSTWSRITPRVCARATVSSSTVTPR